VSALLDVNVLVALAWPNHVHHRAATEWFLSEHVRGWATCPLTQSGFVRVSSNRRVIPDARAPAEAIEVLRRLCGQQGHSFWVDDIAISDCPEIDPTRLSGHSQVTDAHLLALAIRRDGHLVTFDRTIERLATTAEAIETLSL
jgi:toxin-antitoxin system PIN domain toxin